MLLNKLSNGRYIVVYIENQTNELQVYKYIEYTYNTFLHLYNNTKLWKISHLFIIYIFGTLVTTYQVVFASSHN